MTIFKIFWQRNSTFTNETHPLYTETFEYKSISLNTELKASSFNSLRLNLFLIYFHVSSLTFKCVLWKDDIDPFFCTLSLVFILLSVYS